MGYRKIIIAVDCASDDEAKRVQSVAQEISEMFRLRGADVLSIAPMVRKNGAVIATTVRTISQEGMRGVAKMLPYLVKNIKR